MQIQFSELVDSTIRFLEESGSSPKDLIESLDAYIPDNCRHASELDEFFCQLLPHMSFFNYEILKLIILHLNGDHLGKELSAYCLLYTSPSPRDQRGSRMPSSA